ncbi:hypothetical protein LX64_01721 [Chitinophaga skermanii]|uniref:Uncharacterized protein n=1 Tax=Chitinophaga skermanii TaxID=331697 RepID=A0A327QSI0_9BACT|nr:hypothetical protein [Chitinophaga skermanii]RAJ06594.1 hypothetical protein LX64_01721 [Chitinophaga skermanii]
MKYRFLLVMALALTGVIPVSAQDASGSTYAPSPEPDLVFTIFGKTRELLMSDYLDITPTEQSKFIDEIIAYETEKRPWLIERIALLKLYNNMYSSIEEEKMFSLTRQLLNNDKEYAAIQLRYYKRMAKLLGSSRAAKFFQLDNYLESVSRLYVQNDLPFIKELESSRKLLPVVKH